MKGKQFLEVENSFLEKSCTELRERRKRRRKIR
jgi:hypothetical protein